GRVDGSLAYSLASRHELPKSTFRERVHPHRVERLVGGTEVFARLDPTAIASKPFSEQQMRASRFGMYRRVLEIIDRFAKQSLGRVTLAEQGPRTCLNAERP